MGEVGSTRRGRRRPRRAAALAVLAAALAWAPPAGAQETVDAGALRADVGTDPWRLAFTGPPPQAPLEEIASTGSGAVGTLGFRTATGWFRATRVTALERDGDALVATVATTDPGGRTLLVRIGPSGDGIVSLDAEVAGETGDVVATGISFGAPDGEGHLGFGERSNAVDQRGREVENYVAEGPYQEIERPFIAGFVPPPGYHPRDDATYFPIPWLLSTRGIGVLVRNDETSYFNLANQRDDAWSVEVRAPVLRLSVFAGPTPALVLRRFSAHLGRQPALGAPFFLGPWWQPKGSIDDNLEVLKEAGAIGSVMQTYTHYLPCGDQREERERERVERAHGAGLAITTYFNPMICTEYRRVYDEAVRRGVLVRNAAGDPYEYRYTGSDQFFVGQVDFTHPDGFGFYGDLLEEAVGHGYDGWMEDFGEYTPLDARAHDGSTGDALHNRYVTDYHAGAHAYAKSRSPRPLARYNRSGWTGAARHSDVVWNGDPTTSWGFDGLESAVYNGLTMGLSGVSRWGSDVGGFFALSEPQTTPELLARWVQFGFASGVMRTQANGFTIRTERRAQIFDPEVLPVWTRYARLRTQLYPYLAAAEGQYERTGLPLMRHLALVHPADPAARNRHDEYLLGPDLLVAPVVREGATEKSVLLPRGDWIDWWRSVTLDERGAPHIARPEVLAGEREVTLPAPLEEIPMLVRAGALIPLTHSSVETLADYGRGAAVRLRDRLSRMRLLAWPRGKRTVKLGMEMIGDPGGRERIVSVEVRRGWLLSVRGKRKRRYDVEVALGTLRRGGFRPCRVLGGPRGRTPLSRRAWSYDRASGVLRLRFRARSARIIAERRCR